MKSDLLVGITVRELAAVPQFRMRIVAGESGVDEAVSWAHVVDHASPWDWLEPGDLVLTTGGIVPKDAGQQEHFIERLAKAGLSGLVLGEELTPQLSERLTSAADRLGFPVLASHPETSWVEISRLVVRANQAGEGRTLSMIMRIHDAVRIGLQSARSSSDFLHTLGAVIGCRLWLVEQEGWEPVFPDTQPPDDVWRTELAQSVKDRRGTVTRFASLKSGERECLVVPVPIERPVFLVAEGWRDNPPRLTLLTHAAAACAMEIALVDARFDEEWRTGWSLLSQALQGQLDPAALTAALEARGLEPPFLCIAIDTSSETADRMDRFWRVRRIPHIATRLGPALIVLHADEQRAEEIRKLSSIATLRAGISEPFVGMTALADASRQARWALETIAAGETGVAMFAAGGSSFAPRTLLEAERIVERILGTLLRYDEESDSEMVKTLQTYLECDRSPKRAAELLFVHTQTVHYRLQRIQQLTGRCLSSTADISGFWLAMQALAVCRTEPASSAERKS